MGRVSDNKHSYQVKNTFVELVPTDDSQFSRNGQRTLSDTSGYPAARNQFAESPSFIPQTPSPFFSAQPDPCYVPYTQLEQCQLGDGSALLAFGEFGPEDTCSMGYNLEAPGAFGPTFQYDPNTGTYMAFDYGNMPFMPYDSNAICYGMPGQEQMLQVQGVDESRPEEHTQVLLSQLSEKLGEEQIQVSGEVPLEQNSASGNGDELAGNGDMEGNWEGNWEGSSWGHNGNYSSNYGASEDHDQRPSRRRAQRREAREAARRSERNGEWMGGNGGQETEWQGSSCGQEDATAAAAQWGTQAPQNKGATGDITTVMFRNIPNKYTREMLVNQLEQDMNGLFDFIYLPIDFKNKCNVGYAFINFRTVEACDSFVSRFNGVEVRKCLPGLNSRKVTEVTPARVQGFEENVQRLRNSPVMRELVHKPEWMPLIFDYNGENMPFPMPERPLEPIKPRRRARDEEARLL